jgi:hypothetical protein
MNQELSYVILGKCDLKFEEMEVKHIPDPSYELYSPRTTNLSGIQISFKDKSKVYYISFEPREDIYQFIFSCRASKNTENYYYNGAAGTLAEIVGKSTQPYNILSGDTIPETLDVRSKRLIHRYMMEGLHTFWLFNERGLGKIKPIVEENRSRVISTGEHYFQRDDSWALNMSNIFTGMLIDYYRITSGIRGMDSQLSFMDDAEYRLKVFTYMRMVFLRFVRRNSNIGTTDLTDDQIIRKTAEILSNL